MNSQVKRIGILTGGGDCPGLNPAIRAVVKAGSNIYKWESYGIEAGFEGLMRKTFRPLTVEEVRGILYKGGTILGATRRHDPFHYQEEGEGPSRPRDCSAQILENATDIGLDVLVVIGGDGTLTIAEGLWQKGLPLVAIPKTIDNDVSGTDVAIGFHSAVTTAMEALDKLHTTAESHHRVMVVEVMGNKTGWIALESGIAGGADVVLIPEIPFSLEKACEKIATRRKLGRPFSVVVVAEGAKAVGHQETYADPERRRLGGIGQQVAQQIQKFVGLETREIVLGHLQRGGSPTSFDRVLATRFGVHALELIARNDLGKMAALRGEEIGAIPIQEVIAKRKTVDPNGNLVSTAESLGISLGR